MIDRPLGGTEILHERLSELVDLTDINLILSVCHDSFLSYHKPNVLWQHLSYDQENVSRLSDPDFVNSLDAIIFVSHWQHEQFRKRFSLNDVPCYIIPNATDVELGIHKPQKIKLIYTSTPWRGLALLVDVLKRLNRDVDVEIYSGTSIYGPNFHTQNRHLFEPLYNELKDLGCIHHEYASNLDVKESLKSSHIFSYPCTFEETSCLSAIEALAAGCKVVTTSFGALYETCGIWADYVSLSNTLVNDYTKSLQNAIDNYWNDIDQRVYQQAHYKNFWDWSYRKQMWNNVLNEIKLKYVEKSLANLQNSLYIIPKKHQEYLKSIESISPKVVYDIGACMGHWTKAAKNVWKDSQYYLVDATPSMKEFNDAIEVLTDEDGKEIYFYQNDANPTGNSYYKENTEVFTETHRDKRIGKTLDTLRKENGWPLPNLIKLDVQGAEIDIIKGAKETLSECTDIILEAQHEDYNNNAPKLDEVIIYMKSIGFKLTSEIFKSNVDGDYHFSRL